MTYVLAAIVDADNVVLDFTLLKLKEPSVENIRKEIKATWPDQPEEQTRFQIVSWGGS